MDPRVAALRQGDPAAFDATWAELRAPLYGFLTRLTGSPEVGEELVQETFVRLARHAPRLREDTHLRGWMFAVARNLAVSWRRWAWLDLRRRDAFVAPPPPDGPEALAEGREAARRLEAAIAALSPADREIVLLVGVEGMTPSEAAQVLGLTPEAARQRWARAKARLELP